MSKCYQKKPRNQAKFSKKLKKDVLTGITWKEKYGRPPNKKTHHISRKEKYTKSLPLSYEAKYTPFTFLDGQVESVLSYLNIHFKFPETYASKTTLGKMCGVERQRASDIHSFLRDEGILHTINRGPKKTNKTIINPEFKRWALQPWVRRQLSDYLPELYIDPPLAKSLLYSARCAEATQVNININNTRKYVDVDVNVSDIIPFSSKDVCKKDVDVDVIRPSKKNFVETSRRRNETNKHIGEDMSKEVAIPEYLKSIVSLNLTEAGQICLARFPEQAVRAIDDQLYNSSKNPGNPFGYFFGSCRDYCNDNGIDVDVMFEVRLKTKYNVQRDTPVLRNQEVNHAKRSPSQQAGGGSGKSPQKGKHMSPEVPAWVTAQSNRQAEEYEELKHLRTVDHDEYIRRIRSKQKPWHKPHERNNDEQDTRTAVRQPTELDIAWQAWCDGQGADALAAEQANPALNGSAFKAFLATSRYGQYLLERKPILRQFLQPLLRKDYPSESQAADETGPTGAVPQRTATPLPVFKDIALWSENTILAPIVETPYIDETSPWEEMYD